MPDSFSRRRFVGGVGAGVTGALLASRASSYAAILGANDRLRIGLVGFSDRAKAALLPALFTLTQSQNCELVAISDIWSRRRDEGAAFCQTKSGKAPRLFRNNDELYESHAVDAVIIATADFQHAPHGVEALRAGVDAYIEKPLANMIGDANALIDAATSTKRIVQIGTQRRSSRMVQDVRAYLQSGEFGPVTMVDIARNVNQPARWRRPDMVKALREEDTDWTRWRLNRTKDPWDPQKYAEFRLYWPYSCGIPDQWMVHDIDALHFMTGIRRPHSVVANGGIYQWKDGRVNPDTVTIVFDYADAAGKPAFQATFASRMGNSAGTRELYYSNGGTLDTHDGSVTPAGGLEPRYAEAAGRPANKLAPRKLKAQKTASTEAPQVAAVDQGADSTVVAHLRNWIECIRSRQAPVADAQAGYDHAVTLCMTITALHSGRRARYDEARREIVTD